MTATLLTSEKDNKAKYYHTITTFQTANSSGVFIFDRAAMTSLSTAVRIYIQKWHHGPLKCTAQFRESNTAPRWNASETS